MNAEKFSQAHPIANSLWRATAPSEPASEPFEDGARKDVLIIGAGITGAVAALRLQAAGAKVAVLDAGEPGSGASGRSGGFIVPSFSAVRPAQLYKGTGDGADRLLAEIAGSGDLLFQLVAEYGIDCGGAQGGWYQPAHSAEALSSCQADQEVWRAVGGSMEVLDAQETARRTGLTGYHGSLFAPSGGAVHPIKLIYGALTAAQARGATLHTRCRANSLRREQDLWWADTPQGRIAGSRLLVCTNARSAIPGANIESSIVPLRVCQIATTPLSPEERLGLIGFGQSLADTRRNLFTYRFDEAGRLITGAMPLRAAGNTAALGRSMVARLASALQLKRVPEVDYLWFGQGSVTRDRLPALYDLGPDAWALTACNGRGLAASTMLATRTAEMLLHDDPKRLPIPAVRPEPTHLRAMQVIGARMYSLYGRACDRLGL
ncbi:NAD(P)/FAD-dependent oxidoreductase [Parahaliea aestuarii]|uniref:FAD-binding oxidoreductase n=1 Tax=Parahaliea aestuarii TaxID=1852021 RepID=A0A5C8ZYE0_9GAMM|nr:FAD-dependent oxidoreductase [Parahaliea aestuarii]TXS93595.1 FAD-binding oxidoreductase [Parahaliea aestuarii]